MCKPLVHLDTMSSNGHRGEHGIWHPNDVISYMEKGSFQIQLQIIGLVTERAMKLSRFFRIQMRVSDVIIGIKTIEEVEAIAFTHRWSPASISYTCVIAHFPLLVVIMPSNATQGMCSGTG